MYAQTRYFLQYGAYVIAALLIYFSGIQVVHALTLIPSETDSVPYAENSPRDTVSYDLPYPGILPDHPLYSLKIFRDRLLDFLIRDPLKRIEFNLLMSNKRLAMGMYLSDKHDYTLAEETVSKGEKYMVLSVDSVYEAREKGKEIPLETINTLSVAIQKHQQVIEDLREKSPDTLQNGYTSSLQTVSESEGRIADFHQ